MMVVSSNQATNTTNNMEQIINDFPDPKHAIKKCCMKKIAMILSKPELTTEDIQQLQVLNQILNNISIREEEEEKKKEEKIIIGNWVNRKEDFEILKGLVLGNYSYEDWQLIRLLFKVKVIEKLLGSEEIILK